MKIACYHCGLVFETKAWLALDKCPCGAKYGDIFFFKLGLIETQIKELKKWLKGRNIPTETKDNLREKLNAIIKPA